MTIQIGEKFGRLTVIGPAPSVGGRTCVATRCECGVERAFVASRVKGGRVQSCGCLRVDTRIANGVASTPRLVARSTTHGMCDTPEHTTWRGMMDRCSNKNHFAWDCYGGRGIAVDQRWHSFELFFQDMGPRPAGYQLDRIDNDAGYSKENCRWVTAKQNSRNTRANRHVVVNGERMTVAEAAERSGIKYEVYRKSLGPRAGSAVRSGEDNHE